MRLEKQLQCIQCDDSNFPLDISVFPLSLYDYDARPCYWNFLEGYRDSWSICLFIMFDEIFLLGPPSQFVFCSLSPRIEPLIPIRLSSNYSYSWPRPKGPYMSWALIPTYIHTYIYIYIYILYLDFYTILLIEL